MFQTVDGVDCFVIDFKEAPLLSYPVINDASPEIQPYVDALNLAIKQRVITEPGKYAINITTSGQHWNIFKVIE